MNDFFQFIFLLKERYFFILTIFIHFFANKLTNLFSCVIIVSQLFWEYLKLTKRRVAYFNDFRELCCGEKSRFILSEDGLFLLAYDI